MKARISPIGNLEIFRKYEYKVQRCCYHEYKPCGDHCPMFSETPCFGETNTAPVIIKLCQDREIRLGPGEFQDIRAKQEKERDYVFKDFEGNM